MIPSRGSFRCLAYACVLLLCGCVDSAPEAGHQIELDLGKGVFLELVYVGPGSFTMGSDTARYEEEKPAHEVRLSRGFYMGRCEVTKLQFERFLEDCPQWLVDVTRRRRRRKERFKEITADEADAAYVAEDSRIAVVCVNWDHAQAFCAWATATTGSPCRLPTEAEWEYACRAGTRGDYWFDENEQALADCEWYGENSGGRAQAHEVGIKAPNPWGFYDMLGNVCEWCNDWYSETYYRTSPVVDPQGPASGFSRVVRGGSWVQSAERCRSTMRYQRRNWYMDNITGFRVVLDDREP